MGLRGPWIEHRASSGARLGRREYSGEFKATVLGQTRLSGAAVMAQNSLNAAL